eukprot:CAMPEP_0185727042 /NCGR_PEP_ID=MMETSP1171-20130828/2837_1 /TAXON_ID=374046 /ORGANISM="Helicotheca tamensis, Strain CCMP826" /LENGTH=398 /DNA_ID=CAMNT_0028395517 /DNA_START=42 /DNA_END=1238 /DNA_ORIENTATION=+
MSDGKNHNQTEQRRSVTGRRLTRAQGAEIAKETLEILARGSYVPSKSRSENRRKVNLSASLEACLAGSEAVIDPADTSLNAGGPLKARLNFAQTVLRLQAEAVPECQDEELNCGGEKNGDDVKVVMPAPSEQTIINVDASVAAAGITPNGSASKGATHHQNIPACLAERGVTAILPMHIEVHLETTLAGLQSLSREGFNTCGLNFASAKNPGGGFLKGSTAQEECLARTTGLYHSIGHNKMSGFGDKQAPMAMYNLNRSNNRNLLYHDALVYSPSVPLFRDDDCNLLPVDEVVCAAFLSCPAPNTKLAIQRAGDDMVQQTLLDRICKIVSEMELRGHDAVVLGSYGCGVFGNSVDAVARCFAIALAGRKFKVVRFSVISENDAAIFREVFGFQRQKKI